MNTKIYMPTQKETTHTGLKIKLDKEAQKNDLSYDNVANNESCYHKTCPTVL